MPRPRLTAAVRRGLGKLVTAAQSPTVATIDTDTSRAMEYVQTVCHHWEDFARKRPPTASPGRGQQWVMTNQGWVKKPKKKRRNRGIGDRSDER